MQSDELVAAALTALRPRIAAFRFAVSGALERARNTLESGSGPSQIQTALGDFGGRLIDAERFAMISSGAGPLDAAARAAVERAAEVLETLLRAGDEQFIVEVSSGTSLAGAIRARLAILGSVFGAATLIESVRRRSFDPAQRDPPFDRYRFERWNAGERRFAPPLVVRLEGSDVDAFEVAPLIDGWVRLILLVSGPAAPASLARLISPGAFVAQSDDVKVLERVADFDGPAVIAVMSGAEARFVHDPRSGSAMSQRIEVTHLPDTQPRKSFGARSAWQQRDDLAHLKALVQQPVLRALPAEALAASAGGNSSDPAERLTAWLIEEAGLQGVAT